MENATLDASLDQKAAELYSISICAEHGQYIGSVLESLGFEYVYDDVYEEHNYVGSLNHYGNELEFVLSTPVDPLLKTHLKFNYFPGAIINNGEILVPNGAMERGFVECVADYLLSNGLDARLYAEETDAASRTYYGMAA